MKEKKAPWSGSNSDERPISGDVLPIYLNRYILTVVIITLGILPYMSINGLMCHTDATYQVYPFVLETKRMLMSGSPWWSWNTFIGDNFIGGYSYFTYPSPFVWIAMLFPLKYIGLGMVFSVYLKALTCTFFTYRYFRKMGFNMWLSNLGSILYTFCGFSVLTSTYYIFMEPILIFPLVMLATERFLRGENYRHIALIGVFALVILINYYFAPMIAMLTGVYMIVRCWGENMKWGKICKMTLILVIMCAIGYMMVAIMIVPTVYQMTGAPKLDKFGYTLSYPVYLERIRCMFLAPTLEGPNPNVLLTSLWTSTTLYIAVFGILPTVLYVAKNPKNWLSVLIIILLVFYLTPISTIFQLGTNPEYTRWLFATTLFIIMATLRYIDSNRRIKYVMTYIAICMLAYVVPTVLTYIYRAKHDIEYTSFENGYYIGLGLMTIINVAALYYVRDMTDRYKWYVKSTLSVALCSTAFLLCYWLQGYIDRVDESLYMNHLQYSKSEKFEYRTDNYINVNMSMNKNIPGVMSYHSLQNPLIHDLMWTIDTMPYPTKFIPNINRVSFDALVSVRHVIAFKNDTSKVLPYAGIDMEKSNDCYTWYNFEYYIPMGFAYDRYVLREEVAPDLRIMPRPDIPKLMLGSLVISAEDEPELSRLLVRSEKDYDIDLDSVVAQRRRIVCDSFAGDTRGFKAKITLDEPKVIFFSVFADPGFTATIDGKPAKVYNVNLGMSAIVVPAGKHDIDFSYLPYGLKTGAWISLFALLLALVVFFADYRKVRHDAPG